MTRLRGLSLATLLSGRAPAASLIVQCPQVTEGKEQTVTAGTGDDLARLCVCAVLILLTQAGASPAQRGRDRLPGTGGRRGGDAGTGEVRG